MAAINANKGEIIFGLETKFIMVEFIYASLLNFEATSHYVKLQYLTWIVFVAISYWKNLKIRDNPQKCLRKYEIESFGRVESSNPVFRKEAVPTENMAFAAFAEFTEALLILGSRQ